jgi:hypothetical protein
MEGDFTFILVLVLGWVSCSVLGFVQFGSHGFALTATDFLLLVQEKVSKEKDTLPRRLTLRSSL